MKNHVDKTKKQVTEIRRKKRVLTYVTHTRITYVHKKVLIFLDDGRRLLYAYGVQSCLFVFYFFFHPITTKPLSVSTNRKVCSTRLAAVTCMLWAICIICLSRICGVGGYILRNRIDHCAAPEKTERESVRGWLKE